MMHNLYLRSFSFPNEHEENDYIARNYFRGSYRSSFYPFGIFPSLGLKEIEFAPITIFCGDNGSGKSTILNLLAKRLDIAHNSPFNASVYMGDFIDRCGCDFNYSTPPWQSKIITSDDVFSRSFQRREMNMSIHDRQTQVLEEGRELSEDRRYSVNFDDPDDVARFKRKAIAIGKGKSMSGVHQLVMKEVGADLVLHSNGENALEYFVEQIQPHGLYLLDEPENSLSIRRQLTLKQLIEEMAETNYCQFVIATHSPFLLAVENAKIYNLDLWPAAVQKWTDIENVREYFDFFRQYENAFAQDAKVFSSVQQEQSIEDVFRRRLAHEHYHWKEADRLLKQLHNHNAIRYFLEWVDDYQTLYGGLFPSRNEVFQAVMYICCNQEKPIIGGE